MAKVLIADDAAIVRKVVREMLEQGGHEVVAEAADGEEAVARFEEAKPDVAILDVNMPGIDGFAAAARIRELDPDARVIVASVHATGDRDDRAAEVGVRFLRKPFDLPVLLAVIDEALAG